VPHATLQDEARSGQPPLVLTVPGLHNSGPGHWQTLWEQQRHDCHRVELGMWDQPHRNTWVNQLNLAIRAAGRPVVLAAHSLGVIAVVWWAQLEREAAQLVKGALLVAPPEVDFSPRSARRHFCAGADRSAAIPLDSGRQPQRSMDRPACRAPSGQGLGIAFRGSGRGGASQRRIRIGPVAARTNLAR
jgi:predicted alpha/beta hydrolase family esterase